MSLSILVDPVEARKVLTVLTAEATLGSSTSSSDLEFEFAAKK